jgi:hypothetical protein
LQCLAAAVKMPRTPSPGSITITLLSSSSFNLALANCSFVFLKNKKTGLFISAAAVADFYRTTRPALYAPPGGEARNLLNLLGVGTYVGKDVCERIT